MPLCKISKEVRIDQYIETIRSSIAYIAAQMTYAEIPVDKLESVAKDILAIQCQHLNDKPFTNEQKQALENLCNKMMEIIKLQ